MGKNSWEGTPQDFWIPELVAKDAEYGRQEAHLFVNKLVQLYGNTYFLRKLLWNLFWDHSVQI